MSRKYLLRAWLLPGFALMGSMSRAADFVPACSFGVSLRSISGTASVDASASNLCRRWQVVRDPAHPEWPGHYVQGAVACPPARVPGPRGLVAQGPTLRAGERTLLRFGLHNSVTLIAAVALQDGMAGEVIRLRSALGNTVLWGRIQPDGSTELTLHATGQPTIPAGPPEELDSTSRF
jgi:hypothetical protein